MQRAVLCRQLGVNAARTCVPQGTANVWLVRQAAASALARLKPSACQNNTACKAPLTAAGKYVVARVLYCELFRTKLYVHRAVHRAVQGAKGGEGGWSLRQPHPFVLQLLLWATAQGRGACGVCF